MVHIHVSSNSDKEAALIDAISTGKNIWLYGNGNNGKSYHCKRTPVKELIRAKSYSLIYDDEAVADQPLIIHANAPPSRATLNDANFICIEFLGQYDAATDTYV